jgi:hypothetical protein
MLLNTHLKKREAGLRHALIPFRFEKICRRTLLGGLRPMKKLIRLLVFAALVATLALPALAQTTPATPAATPAASQDEAQAKVDLYDKLVKNRAANPPVAYEAAKEYIQKYGADNDQYVNYAKKYVTAYEKQARRNQFSEQLKAKNYNDAFTIGKQILAEEPEDLGVLFELTRAGFAAAGNKNTANNADTIAFAKKTIQLLQAGRTFEKDKPVANKDDLIGGINFELGSLLKDTQPAEAVTYLINAAQTEGSTKKDFRTYLFLADIYEKGEYKTLSTQYNANCKTEEQVATAECTQLKAKADQIVDHMIDALARAIAYNDASPNAAGNAAARASWLEQLTSYYKYRNNNDDKGLKEYIAGITSRPLPKPGDPIAPMTPASTPASTNTPAQPGSTTNAAPSNTTTTPSTSAKPMTTSAKPSTTTTTAQPNGNKAATAQPTTKTSSTKTTPKRAHAKAKRG